MSLSLSFENKTVREKNITGRPQPPQCKDDKSGKGRCGFQRQFSKNNHQSSCFCDPECNTVFKDCCADFHQQCNTSFLLEHHIGSEFDNRWKCMDVDHHNIWMIRRCRPGWNDDEVLRRCTEMEPNNTSQLIPVIDQYNNTFFNRYCATCNNVTEFSQWEFDVYCDVKHPAGYTERQWAVFLDFFCPKSH